MLVEQAFERHRLERISALPKMSSAVQQRTREAISNGFKRQLQPADILEEISIVRMSAEAWR
jgi:hypothetical protein